MGGIDFGATAEIQSRCRHGGHAPDRPGRGRLCSSPMAGALPVSSVLWNAGASPSSALRDSMRRYPGPAACARISCSSARSADRVVSRNELLREVWRFEDVTSSVLDTTIHRLRRKLEKHIGRPGRLEEAVPTVVEGS